MKASSLPSPRAAFSLVELLVVCSIIAVIVGLTIPAANTLIRGSAMTQGASMVNDQISLARGLALSRNRPVEVRFYKFADPETPGEDKKNEETWKFRALQTLEILENGAAIPMGKVQYLPNNVVMNDGALSTLLDDRVRGELKKPGGPDPELPRDVKKDYKFYSFRFLQDGSTDLPLKTSGSSTNERRWYLTLQALTDNISKESKTPPPNFFTLQIDPITGATKSYRPNAG